MLSQAVQIERSGNGGLMRLAPAIITAKTKDEAIMFAKESTRLTYGAKEVECTKRC